MNIKMWFVKKVGLHAMAPRWLKVICLQITMSEIEREINAVFAKVDLSKITKEQRDSLNAQITKMNLARGKGMKA
ncbi:hypothetical protein AAIG39_01580 [Phytobacter palmae]|uniref:Uncharacterized protein n=1 Tax=Phytobacter palmae TaxID=1855371 RepID=A0ABU9UZ88_9ENTR